MYHCESETWRVDDGDATPDARRVDDGEADDDTEKDDDDDDDDDANVSSSAQLTATTAATADESIIVALPVIVGAAGNVAGVPRVDGDIDAVAETAILSACRGGDATS